MSESNDKTWCVYMHTSPNGKKYIGITSMNQPEQRWRNGAGYQHNEYFYSAIKKYGWDNFEHNIIASGLNENDAMCMERLLIEEYNTTDNKFGYNLTSGGEIGKTHSEETKRKIADKNSNPSDETRERKRSAAQKRCDNEWRKFISEANKEKWKDEEYRKEQSAKRKGRVMSEEWRLHMGESRRGQKRSEEFKRKISEYHKGKKLPASSVAKMAKAHKKAVVQLDLSGFFITEFDSAKDAYDNTGVIASSITACCKDKSKSAGGFLWIYKTDYDNGVRKVYENSKLTKVVQLSLNYCFINEYISMADASRKTDVPISEISLCCNNKLESAHGFKWMRKSDWDKFQLTIQNELEDVNELQII